MRALGLQGRSPNGIHAVIRGDIVLFKHKHPPEYQSCVLHHTRGFSSFFPDVRRSRHLHIVTSNASAYTHNVESSQAPTAVDVLKALGTVSVACSLLALLPSGAAGPFASFTLAAGNVSAESLKTAIRSAWAGVAAGFLHTLAGADHLAALTPLTIGRSYIRASFLGALWGLGHSTGQLILGLLMVLLKDRFQALVPALSKWGGTTVGLTLLAIGALGVYESFFEQETHEQAVQTVSLEGGTLSNDTAATLGTNSSTKKEKKGFGLATFATGIIYGLQPDALFVIIPALALPTKIAAAAYIIMFVFGTVTAMGAYTGVIGATSAAIKKSNSSMTQKLSGAASFIAIVIGLAVLASGWGINIPLPFFNSH